MKHPIPFLVLCVLASVSSWGQESGPLFDEASLIERPEEMEYPLAARLKQVQGVVVIVVEVDQAGKAVRTSALSGPRLLVPGALANAKTWTFHRTSIGRAVIVYDFRIEGSCKLPCRSQFLFRAPNVAVIRTGQPMIEE